MKLEIGETFIFKPYNTISLPAFCMDIVSQTLKYDENGDEYCREVYLCYAQNRLFYYDGEEYVKIICQFCVIPELDQALNNQ